MVDDYHRISRAVTGSVLVRRIVVHHDQALKSRKLSSLFWIERRFCIGEIALKTQGVFGGSFFVHNLVSREGRGGNHEASD